MPETPPQLEEVTFAALERTSFPPARSEALATEAKTPVAFTVGSAPLVVRFSRDAFAADFAERYAELAKRAPAGRLNHDGRNLPPAITLNVVEHDSETFFWAQPERVWRWSEGRLNPLAAGFFADAALHHEFVRLARFVTFHSAAVALNGVCAALAGTTTAGKTTTAIACARAGMRLYSDERCILEGARVVPFPRRLTLRAGGRTALLEDEQRALDQTGQPVGPGSTFADLLRSWNGCGEISVNPSRLLGAASVGGPPLPLRAMFVLDGLGDSPVITPTTALAAARDLVLSLSSGTSALERIAVLLHVLRGVDVYRLHVGRPAETAQAIKEILARAEFAARN